MGNYSNTSKAGLGRRSPWLPRRLAKVARASTNLRAAGQAVFAGMRDSETQLRAVLQTAVEGIITINERGIVESINPAAERMFGFKAKEVIGHSVNRLMPSPHRERHDGYIADYLRTGRARIIGIGREIVGQHKNGTVFPVDLAVSEVRSGGRRRFTGFVRDITERKRLEQEILEVGDRERQRIGHDLHDGLCQHLAGVELMSQVLEQKLTRRAKAEAARAGEIARRVREAISQTQALARGLSPVTLEAEGLFSALRELAASTERIFGTSCRVESAGLATARVWELAVATHLYRIAQEAVANALKHGKATRIVIRLEAGRDGTVLKISDNGRGFPARRPKGGGMGLRIMRYRAGMIGGVLSVERARAGGTVVVCSVPVHSVGSRRGKRGKVT